MARHKQSSLSNLEARPGTEALAYNQPPPPPPPKRKKSKGREEMRGATARGINYILSTNPHMSLPVITEIYIATASATGNDHAASRLTPPLSFRRPPTPPLFAVLSA